MGLAWPHLLQQHQPLRTQTLQAGGPAAAAILAAQQKAAQISGAVLPAGADTGGVEATHFQQELEINDYPQTARWKVTHKDTMSPILEFYQVCITTKGSWYAPGRNAPPGDRKLYLLIEGSDEKNVVTAKKEIRRMLEEAAAGIKDPSQLMKGGRYTV